MAFLAKGVPAKAVAALEPPNELVLVVRPDLPVRSAADLEGRSIGVTGRPSPAGWSRRSRAAGLRRPNGIKMNARQPQASGR
jgi:ABC-type nitrate/sulfonate/bicarbonate transport system substrate-binding protein